MAENSKGNLKFKFKEIHIGNIIRERWEEKNIDMVRTCNFLKTDEDKILEMFTQPGINSEILLRWSKLLEYDFFRIYSQHLILYAPSASDNVKDTKLPVFRKNIYTKEIIEFILGRIANKEKTKSEIIKEYGIPKATLYKWISKYDDTI